jgi:hypothetical protein
MKNVFGNDITESINSIVRPALWCLIVNALDSSTVHYWIVDEHSAVELVGPRSFNHTVDRLEWPPAQIQTPLDGWSATICDLIKKLILLSFWIASVLHTGPTEDPTARVRAGVSTVLSQQDFEDEMIAQVPRSEMSFC